MTNNSKKVVCSFVPKEEHETINCGFATDYILETPKNYNHKANLSEDLIEDIAKQLNTTKKNVDKLLIDDLNLTI
ncbi:MAG: hypothetical protein LBU14_04115 [Candidatus Peribacteria bacterium]|jgi:hypothetical protein|nr:hypothetical protein [Candidatus Peribacteria bacterium]